MFIYTQKGCIFVGKAFQNAEHKRVGAKETDMTRFSIAYSSHVKDGKELTDYMNVVAWGKLARNIAGIEKGDVVLVAGTIETQTYRRRDGTEGKSTQITAEMVMVQPQYTDGLPPDRDKWASDYGSAYGDETPDVALPF